MREFKFRVWDNKDKKWIHGPGEEVSLLGEMILMGGFLKGISIESLNDLEVLQFTGVRDKYGKEIYEGDILSNGFDRNHNVVFKNAAFGLETGDGFSPLHQLRFRPLTEEEVVGNIYENSELLKTNGK